MTRKPLLSIILPVYNEQDTVAQVIHRLFQVSWSDYRLQILVIDDGSTDATARKLVALQKHPSIVVVHHPYNLGKGAAIRTGLHYARGEIIAIQDADLEYHPQDLPKLLGVFADTTVQVVYGSRKLNPANTQYSHWTFFLGGMFLTWLTNRLYEGNLTDESTGYKLFRSPLLRSLDLACKRFEFCPEVTAKILRQKITIVEKPVRYIPRSRSQGKKIRCRDFVAAVFTLIKFRLVV